MCKESKNSVNNTKHYNFAVAAWKLIVQQNY